MSLHVLLEAITPVFLSGAYPHGAPELRAASLRGALRFWLRALLGGVMGDSRDQLDELRKAESAVFGSTQCSSPVVVRIQPRDFSHLAEWDYRTHGYRKPGIAYLFFAARGTKNEPTRRAIEAGSSFELFLSKRSGISAPDNQVFERAYAALWLLTHLGGLGARATRGGGGLQAINMSDKPSHLPSLIVSATTPDGLRDELRDGLKCLRQLVGNQSHSSNPTMPSSFDVLHPLVCRIWVMNILFDSWDEALDALGRAMQKFRNRRPPDYQNVKAAVQGQTLTEPVKRAAFGLPIVFYYSSLGGKQGTLMGEHHDRRASPLIIRVTKLGNGKYAVVLTVFYARLLDKDERLKLERPGRPPCTVEPPDLNLIDDFLSDLDNKVAPRLEVTGW